MWGIMGFGVGGINMLGNHVLGFRTIRDLPADSVDGLWFGVLLDLRSSIC